MKKKRSSSKKPYNKFGNKKTEIDGILFDSQLEGKFYEHLKQLKKTKKIKDFELQPEFILQEKFKKNGKSYREIKYIADFKVFNLDNSFYIVDTKGILTHEFKLKEKMFHYHYPDIELKLMKHVLKFGGWITLDEYKQKKKEEKK